ncbi:ABC transporter ATP-binding protein [bacterium]|nr:ABC transporter ATP-binding protein [bacterium]
MEIILETQNLCKNYFPGEKEVKVLKNINLKIETGKIYVILGPSGAGKSTLLHIFGTIERPSEGNFFFIGQDINDFSKDQLAVLRSREIGFIFQSHLLLPEFTALENVMIPAFIRAENPESRLEGSNEKKADIKKRALKGLEEVGLKNRVNHKPQQLSGGEQQRVAVARALINNPSLILADEPTGNLDKEIGKRVFQLLLDLNKRRGTTLIVVTHNEELAKCCNQRIYLEDGHIVV